MAQSIPPKRTPTPTKLERSIELSKLSQSPAPLEESRAKIIMTPPSTPLRSQSPAVGFPIQPTFQPMIPQRPQSQVQRAPTPVQAVTMPVQRPQTPMQPVSFNVKMTQKTPVPAPEPPRQRAPTPVQAFTMPVHQPTQQSAPPKDSALRRMITEADRLEKNLIPCFP